MGETNFFGNLTISSDYLTFQAYDAHIQNSFEPSLNFQSKIAALTAYGPVNVSISQLKGVINSSESLHITSENKTLGITIHLLEDSQLIIQSINPIKQITLIGPDEITVKATLSPKDAFFLDSHFTSIKIEGKISFGKAYGVWPISNYLLAGDRINIIGTVSFKTKFAEQLSYTYLEDEGRAFYISSDQQTLIYLTNLTLSGTTIQDLYFGGNSVASDELSLPWVEIFTSYWNILLLTLMIIPIVILQILKKSRRLQQQPSMQLQKNKF
jgi:hypothetical protein